MSEFSGYQVPAEFRKDLSKFSFLKISNFHSRTDLQRKLFLRFHDLAKQDAKPRHFNKL